MQFVVILLRWILCLKMCFPFRLDCILIYPLPFLVLLLLLLQALISLFSFLLFITGFSHLVRDKCEVGAERPWVTSLSFSCPKIKAKNSCKALIKWTSLRAHELPQIWRLYLEIQTRGTFFFKKKCFLAIPKSRSSTIEPLKFWAYHKLYVYDCLKFKLARFYLMAAFSEQEFEHNRSAFLYFIFSFYLVYINLFLLGGAYCLLKHTFRSDGSVWLQ